MLFLHATSKREPLAVCLFFLAVDAVVIIGTIMAAHYIPMLWN